MIYRKAVLSDIPQIMKVRLAVKGNVLSNPDGTKETRFEMRVED